MFGSNILEIAIGLIFIYLLYSLLATTIKEGIAAIFGLRAKMLGKAIRRMLDDGVAEPHSLWSWIGLRLEKIWGVIRGFVYFIVPHPKLEADNGKSLLVKEFYKHPAIKYLGSSRLYRRPSYISPDYFSKALIDMFREMGKDPAKVQSKAEMVADGISNIGVTIPARIPETKALIQSYYDDANGDLEKFKASLEKWFDETMQRASGWYKRQVQVIIFIIGFLLAVIFNVDTITIVKKLSTDKDARNSLVEMASVAIKNYKDSTGQLKPLVKSADSLFTEVNRQVTEDIAGANTLMGLGWDVPIRFDSCTVSKTSYDYETNMSNCSACLDSIKKDSEKIYLGRCDKVRYVWCMATSGPRKFIGYLITAIAISFGAPFWFDLLNKVMQLRGAGKKPEETVPATAKEDAKPERVG